ncbi:hypothetical protein FOCC_FOCC013716 [Frankliniella occidentalis]|nr:hypothetical protein FOCC_FOCC013716 [Frankliniella occidentalis]
MPRAPAIPHEDLKKLIVKADVVDNEGNVYGPSNSVWQDLSTRTEGIYDANYMWKDIKPHEIFVERKERGNPRRKMVLRQFKWEPVIIECLWDQAQLPCPYSFSKGTVYTSETSLHYIKMNASCPECGATATGTILTEPLDNEHARLEWRANDTRGVPHRKKRPLSHDLRRQTGKELQGLSSSSYRRREASKIMKHGDVEPPHLFTAQVLNRAQQEETDRVYDIVTDSKDPIGNLRRMKGTNIFAGMIHQIGLDPFFVLYHSHAQLKVYKKFSATCYIVMAIDATGSLVRKVETCTGMKSPHIFLYEAVIQAGDQQLPVCQMLSARQDASIIQFWIREFMRQGARSPDEIVVDNSKALINAVVVTFCGCYSLDDYYNRCFSVLTDDSLSETEAFNELLPLSYLRLDVAHLFGGAAKWDVWKVEATKRLKTFFLMCLGLLVYETTAVGFRDTFIMTCMVAASEYSTLEVSNGKSQLVQRIEGAPPEVLQLTTQDEEIGETDTDDEDDLFDCGSDEEQETTVLPNIKQFIKEIKETVASKLKEVSNKDADENVNNVRNKKERKSKKRARIFETDGSEDSETELQKSLNESENWRGLAPTPKRSTKSKYLNPCPELSVAFGAKSIKPPKERLLENGMIRGFSKTDDNSEAQLTNTCAFDVIAQMVTCAYIQYDVYRNSLDLYPDEDVLNVCKSLAVEGAVTATYKLRLITLSKVTVPAKVVAPPLSVTRQRKSHVAITYDCFSDLIDLSRELLKNVVSLSVKYKCSQRKFRPCTSGNDHSIINADMGVLHDKGIEKLDEAVLVGVNVMHATTEEKPAENPVSIQCQPPCKGSATITCDFGPHLIINIDVFGSSGEHKAKKQFVRIEDVPVKMNLLGKSFVLSGLGARESSHYIAYCRKATGQWEVFNDLAKRVSVVKESKHVQPVIVMYVPT